MFNQERDNSMRVILISDLPNLVANHFGGLTINSAGVVRIGNTDIYRDEIGHALVETIAIINDSVAEIFETTDHKVIEKNAEVIINSPELLSLRQDLFEKVVLGIRQSPDIQVTTK